MNFEKLIEKLETLGTGYSGMLLIWLGKLPDCGGFSYDTIYGFVRGLAATNFITDSEESELLKQLIALSYGDCE